MKKSSFRRIKGLKHFYKEIIHRVREMKPQILLNTCFKSWRNIIVKRNYLENALRDYQARARDKLMVKAWSKWIEKSMEIKADKESIELCKGFYSMNLQKKGLKALREEVSQARVPKFCDAYVREKNLSRSFQLWWDWVEKMKVLRFISDRKKEREDKLLKREYFEVLLEEKQRRDHMREKERQITLIMKRKFMSLWAQSINSFRNHGIIQKVKISSSLKTHQVWSKTVLLK